MKSNIPNRIKQLRENKRYTQEYMADALKISQRAYSTLECGKSQLSVERLLQIADLLETNVAELIGADATAIQNNFNNTTGNKGNLVVNQNNYQQLQELYERLVQSKDAEIEQLKARLKD